MYVPLSLPPIRSLGSVQPKPHREFMGAEEESAAQICIHHRQLLQKRNGKSAKILSGKGWQYFALQKWMQEVSVMGITCVLWGALLLLSMFFPGWLQSWYYKASKGRVFSVTESLANCEIK